MALATLPLEIVCRIALYLTGNSASLFKLSQTCSSLYGICRPLLYRHIDLDQSNKEWLLPIAYTILTCPAVAREVRTLRLPALGTAPALPRPHPLRDGLKLHKSPSRGWPDHPNLHIVLKDEVTAALEGEDAQSIEACYSAVCIGTREDLIAMLILRNTPGLEELDFGAMGPRIDNSHTRHMFRHAAPRLTRLTTVAFGRTPYDLSDLVVPRTDLDFSYSLFADLLLLPAIKELTVFAIGPRSYIDYPESEWDTVFDFVCDIESENTSLETLKVSEQLASSNKHLDHLFKHCTALQSFGFLSRRLSGTDDMQYNWGTTWNLHSLEKTLELRADSLSELELVDCLFHDEAKIEDERSHIRLRGLPKLSLVYLNDYWLFDGEAYMDYTEGGLNRESIEQRLVSLLPDSIEELHLISESDDGPHDEMVDIALQTFIQQRAAHEGLQRLKSLHLGLYTKKRIERCRVTIDMAEAEGIKVNILV